MKKLLLLLLCAPLIFTCDYNEKQMKIKKLEKDKDRLNNEMIESEEKLEKLNNNTQELDDFAREKLLIKKENEDIIIIEK
tara:strand:+ start:91 stop:330 length:240 start_codon:yes stop_codon:yes gene_type:complete